MNTDLSLQIEFETIEWMGRKNGRLLNDKYSPVKWYICELFDTLNTETSFWESHHW